MSCRAFISKDRFPSMTLRSYCAIRPPKSRTSASGLELRSPHRRSLFAESRSAQVLCLEHAAWHRMAEPIALYFVAIEQAQESRLFLGLHALGDDIQLHG